MAPGRIDGGGHSPSSSVRFLRADPRGFFVRPFHPVPGVVEESLGSPTLYPPPTAARDLPTDSPRCFRSYLRGWTKAVVAGGEGGRGFEETFAPFLPPRRGDGMEPGVTSATRVLRAIAVDPLNQHCDGAIDDRFG